MCAWNFIGRLHYKMETLLTFDSSPMADTMLYGTLKTINSPNASRTLHSPLSHLFLFQLQPHLALLLLFTSMQCFIHFTSPDKAFIKTAFLLKHCTGLTGRLHQRLNLLLHLNLLLLLLFVKGFVRLKLFYLQQKLFNWFLKNCLSTVSLMDKNCTWSCLFDESITPIIVTIFFCNYLLVTHMVLIYGLSFCYLDGTVV